MEISKKLESRARSLWGSLFWNILAGLYVRFNVRTKSKLLESHVISLTSYPARIGKLHLTIQSLLWQRDISAKIFLTLSRPEFPNSMDSLPKKLICLYEKNETFEIIWVDENMKSYKKYFPIGQLHPNHSVITVDDDVIYPPTLVSTMLEASKQFPNTIIGTRASVVGIKGKELLPYANWKDAESGRAGHDVFLTGRGGILYPPKSLHYDVFNFKLAENLAPDADDIWFKLMAFRAGTKNMRISLGSEFPSTFLSQRQSLFKKNVGQGANDQILVNVIQEFNIELEECQSAQ